MLTLVHEDIYVYIDKIEEHIQTLSGASDFVLSNDATGLMVDPGVVEINVISGSYTSLTMTKGTDTLTINQPMPTGSLMVIDLRDNFYTLDGSLFLPESYLTLENDALNTLNLSLSGTGTVEVKYKRNLAVTNNMDLYFCTGLDVSENTEIIRKTNIKAQTKVRKTAKKDYQWSINGLWNETELQKFESDSGLFRLRLVDEDGLELEKLVNCVISSFQRSSSETGDYVYTLNGSCEKIF